ncbi:COR domain-containing protein, partial [Spirosoma lacussanchae]
IENLPAGLQSLHLSRTSVSQIENLPAGLQSLDLSYTSVSQIENLPAGLQSLDLSYTSVSQIENLPAGLQSLDLSETSVSQIEDLPAGLQSLYLTGNKTRNIPTELLGKNYRDNCLGNVRAWFSDLADKSALNQMVKFMVSGNSNVGKSSLLEALKAGKAQPGKDSTHAIRIESLPLFNGMVQGVVFDFGGQEIYHGTHQLFLRSRAVQVIVFDAETEAISLAQDRRGKRGDTNRNKILPDWLDNLERLSPDSAFVVVQNKTETQTPVPATTQALVNQLEAEQQVWTARVSACSGRGIAGLIGTLTEAAQSLPEYNMPFPASWLAVRDYFIRNSQQEITKRERLVAKSDFFQLCRQHQVLTGAEEVLLQYLHNTGILYFDEQFLNDTIIADQQWAIEAIYEVLDREGRLYDELANETFGKKRLKYLFDYFKTQYTVAERRLFVRLMESCGLCFPLNERRYESVTDDTYYLFPQFLDENLPSSAEQFLKDNLNKQIYQQSVPFLPYYHIQQCIARWGAKTDFRNIWRTGLLVDLAHEGRFVLEADLINNTLTLSTDCISGETITQLQTDFTYQNANWQLTSGQPALAREPEPVQTSSQPLIKTVPDVAQPKIRKLVVSFAKEDKYYVDLLRKKVAARKTIELWYDRHLTGWGDWDNQIKQHFLDCDGYIIFLSDAYMDAETKTYIHKEEVPIMRRRFDDKEAFVIVINVTEFDTQDTDLEPFLRFDKGAVMPSPDEQPKEASQFLEKFIRNKLYNDFLKENSSD